MTNSASEGEVSDLVGGALRTLIAEEQRGGRGEGDWIAAIWQRMRAAGFHELGADAESGGLAPAARAMEELGRAACNVPLASAVAARACGLDGTGVALAGDCPAAVLNLATRRLSGTVHSEEAPGAVALLVLAGDGAALVDAGSATGLRTSAGLGVMPVERFEFRDAAIRKIVADPAQVERAGRCARLLFLARALGAAEQSLALVVDYVQQRVQFGQSLGRFQAMQHKLADCALWISAVRLTHRAAVAAYDAESAAAGDLADAAAVLAPDFLGRAAFEIEHGFGAIGYAEEHDAARLFRQIQVDCNRLGGGRRARLALAARLIDDAVVLPEPDLGSAARTVRDEIRAWLESNWTAADRELQAAIPFADRNRSEILARRLGRDGWLSAGWPLEAGGRALPPSGQMALVEELTLADAPFAGVVASAWIVAPEIIRHGSHALQAELLPLIQSGEASFALGYSEPEAGSDLAALRTRAVRDGDHYVVQGQKLWGTGTETATHIVLAVRTDPEAKPKSAGISLLVVPADLPGITIKPSMALYGRTFCTQFYDHVRVPAHYLLGAENGGWTVLGGALATERIQMGGIVVQTIKVFQDFCGHVRADGGLAGDGEARALVGRFAAELVAARLLAARSVELLDGQRVPLVEGAMTKIFSGDLAERFARAAIDLVGADAMRGETDPGAPLAGALEQLLRRSIMMVIGGGAAEIQKTIIAQQGLGLPR